MGVALMSTVSREELLSYTERLGLGARVEQAALELPDSIDEEHEQELLARFGLARGQLIDRFAGSPSVRAQRPQTTTSGECPASK